MDSLLFGCLVIVGSFQAVLSGSLDSVLTWNTNTNFENPLNWEGNKLPCPNDRVIFSSSSDIAVFMPATFSVAEIVLPLNGELIFPTNAVLNITGGHSDDSCIGQDVFFRTSEDYWYNPDNWNITSNRAFPSSPSRRNLAVPHVFQVPSPRDDVVFPGKASFKVLGLETVRPVSSLSINEHAYTQSEVDILLHSPTGRLLFPDTSGILIRPQPCEDPRGCLPLDEMIAYEEMCLLKSPPPEPLCFDPIKVKGHCSDMCAAKITAKILQRFQMEEFLKLHQNLHSKDVFSTVESFTARISEDQVQTVFVDDAPGNLVANKMAELMYTIYLADLKSTKKYGLDSIEIQKSEKWKDGRSDQESGSSSAGLSSGGVAAIIIFIATILGFAVFFVYRKQQIPGFSFARFDLRGDKIELELGTTPHDELEPGEGPTPATAPKEDDAGKGFDNPIYGTEIEPEDSEIVEGGQKVQDFVENPMFTLFENKESEEKEKSSN